MEYDDRKGRIYRIQIDNLGYRMTFSNREGRGTIITNLALVDPVDLPRAMEIIRMFFLARRSGYGRPTGDCARGRNWRDSKRPGYKCFIGNGVQHDAQWHHVIRAGARDIHGLAGLLEMRKRQTDPFCGID